MKKRYLRYRLQSYSSFAIINYGQFRIASNPRDRHNSSSCLDCRSKSLRALCRERGHFSGDFLAGKLPQRYIHKCVLGRLWKPPELTAGERLIPPRQSISMASGTKPSRPRGEPPESANFGLRYLGTSKKQPLYHRRTVDEARYE